MKKIITIINNTRRIAKLLSDPQLIETLQKQLTPITPVSASHKLGRADLYHHKYYMVQVLH